MLVLTTITLLLVPFTIAFIVYIATIVLGIAFVIHELPKIH
jgi:hypothetical protein